MKKVILKISSFLMALLVLFSTMSFGISEHFCGNLLVDTSIFSTPETCGMEMEKTSPKEGCSIEKNNCCKDVVKLIEGNDNLNISISKIDFQQELLVASLYLTYIDIFEGLEENIIPNIGYPPPLLITDIQLLDGIFLI